CAYHCLLFSSRRRHTRSKRDWSSDVCSSDLVVQGIILLVGDAEDEDDARADEQDDALDDIGPDDALDAAEERVDDREHADGPGEIGRASCRERAAGTQVTGAARGPSRPPGRS